MLLALLLGRTEFSVLFNQQLLYPNTTRPVSDGELHGTLQLVGLPLLVERCGGFDAELDFGKLLSIGEQQRLAVARVLLSAHAYVILDEATSALDADNEQRMYSLMQRTGATLISVAHHRRLARFHGQLLDLNAEGGWRLERP